MFFKFINASIICQELINNILKKYFDIFMIAYLNVILIYFNIKEKYIKHVNIVLKLLMQKNLLLKSKKCFFHKKKVNFLDFTIENNIARMNLTKVQAVKK